MDKQFEKNFLKPGDEGYVYDKVVDFKNQKKESNSWDNSKSDNYSEDDWDA